MKININNLITELLNKRPTNMHDCVPRCHFCAQRVYYTDGSGFNCGNSVSGKPTRQCCGNTLNTLNMEILKSIPHDVITEFLL